MARSTPPREGRVGQIAADPTEFCARKSPLPPTLQVPLTDTTMGARAVCCVNVQPWRLRGRLSVSAPEGEQANVDGGVPRGSGGRASMRRVDDPASAGCARSCGRARLPGRRSRRVPRAVPRACRPVAAPKPNDPRATARFSWTPRRNASHLRWR